MLFSSFFLKIHLRIYQYSDEDLSIFGHSDFISTTGSSSTCVLFLSWYRFSSDT